MLTCWHLTLVVGVHTCAFKGKVVLALKDVDTTLTNQAETIATLRAGITAGKNDAAIQNGRIGKMEAVLESQQALLQAFLKPVQRAPPTQFDSCGNAGQGGGGSNLVCAPEVESFSSSFTDGALPVDLNLKATSGGVYFEGKDCPPTNLCNLARDVQGVLEKFNGE